MKELAAVLTSVCTVAGRPATCALAQFLECPCFYEDSVAGNTDRFHTLTQAFNRELQYIATLEKERGLK